MLSKKIIAVLLTFVTIAGLSSGCGTKSNSNSEQEKKDTALIVTAAGSLPIVTEPLTLTLGLAPDDTVSDYIDNHYTKFLQEKTGIDFDFFYLPTTGSEMLQKIQLMVAANDTLPDLLLNVYFDNSTKASYGKQGIVLPLEDYMDEYGHFWKASYEKYCSDTEKNLINKLSISPDGKMYGFPFYDVDPTDSQVESLYINKDWCKAVNMEIPTTTDELFDVLVAFRDLDPNGNGLRDEIPLVGYNSVDVRGDLIFLLANSFLYYNYSSYGRFNVDNGKLNAAYTKDEFREALRYINKLYEEKLLFPISFTQDASQLKAMIDLPDGNDTIAGGVAVHPWSGSQGFTYNVDEYNKLEEYAAIGPLTGPAGVAWSPYYVSGLSFNSFITRDCKNPKAAFRLLDYMSDETVSLMSRRGELGVDWDYVQGDEISKFDGLGYDAIYNVLNDVWAQPEQNKMYGIEIQMLPSALFSGISAPTYETEKEKHKDELFLDGFYRRAGQYPEEIVTNLIYTDEELAKINEISTNITEYANEARVLFATGAKDIETDWDGYIKDLNDMGLDTWLEVAQVAYDRMNA